MDAPVRYVRSRDGTRIAYSVAGAGPPLILLQAASTSHIELYPRLRGGSEYLAQLGHGRTLVRIDFRGHGMSDRLVKDHSPEAFTDDLEAVVDELQITRADLVAAGARVTPALGLAVRRPGVVARLVLADPFTVRPPAGTQAAPAGLQSLMESNWELFLEVTINRNAGRPIGYVRETASFVRRCMDQRNCVAEVKSRRPTTDWDAAPLIDIPVLVMEFADNIHVIPRLLADFAERFPQGRFIALPEGALPPPYGDPQPYLRAVAEFLESTQSAHQPPAPREAVRLTPREAEVLRLLAAGRTQPQIARTLAISPSTVSRHVVNVYAKIGAHRRAEAVTWAMRNGFNQGRKTW